MPLCAFWICISTENFACIIFILTFFIYSKISSAVVLIPQNRQNNYESYFLVFYQYSQIILFEKIVKILLSVFFRLSDGANETFDIHWQVFISPENHHNLSVTDNTNISCTKMNSLSFPSKRVVWNQLQSAQVSVQLP